MFEIKSLKSENLKNEYLQTQAYLHLEFLTKFTQTLKDESIETLEYRDNIFTLKVEVHPQKYELFVDANDLNVSLHKTITK